MVYESCLRKSTGLITRAHSTGCPILQPYYCTVWCQEWIQKEMQLIQTCMIHYCFLGSQEFNDLIKSDIVFDFLIFGPELKRVAFSTYFFNHIYRQQMIILDNIYHLIKRQMLTQLFRQQKNGSIFQILTSLSKQARTWCPCRIGRTPGILLHLPTFRRRGISIYRKQCGPFQGSRQASFLSHREAPQK